MKNNKKEKPIIVILSYARSGTTLLNRCLASLPNTIILSEINIEAACPNSCPTIKEQAKKWYGIKLKSKSFIENIKEIYEYCLLNNTTLIIRDWTFGSFVPSKHNNLKPSKSFSTLDAVSTSLPVKSFAFVRNPVDIWLSLKASPRTFHDKNLNFLYELSKKLTEKKIKIFKYEDFCKNPTKEMKKICKYSGLEYSDLFLNYKDCYNVTGDTDLPEHSRGIKKGKIVLLPRQKSFKLFSKEIHNNTRAGEIAKLLKYI